MYLSNSHPRRDLPTPAGPETTTSRGVFRSTEAWKRSFSARSSTSRPVNGASRPSARFLPPTPESTRMARKSCSGCSFPFNSKLPASSNKMEDSESLLVPASTSTVPEPATDCTREAVFTASPATMPSPWAPMVTATSPVTTPARAARSGAPTSAPSTPTAPTRSKAARTARSVSPSSATGVPHTAITASPMNFSTIPP